MAGLPNFKYRAFISYSHKDRRWGDWVHSALEGYRIPKDLVGRANPSGAVPAKLRPIFRDRFELAAGHSLSDAIAIALRESAFLIVICSPDSAKSAYVNQELCRFKELGKGDCILALIVAGEPHNPECECFPDALKYKVDDAGRITREADREPIAADARPHADGRDLAKLKLVAGLLGVGLDEIRKREEIAERRRRRMWTGLAATMAVLAVAAGLAAWIAVLRTRDAERRFDLAFDAARNTAYRVQSMTDQLGVPESVLAAMLQDAERNLDKLTAEDGSTSDEFRFRQAQVHMLFADMSRRQGKPEAEGRLRHALDILEPLAASDPSNKNGWVRQTAVAHGMLADLFAENNERDKASASYRKNLQLLEQISARTPTDENPQNDVAVGYAKLGDFLRNGEDGAKPALELYEKSLRIFEHLATDHPSNREWQRNYGVTLLQVGEAQSALGQAPAALKSLTAAVAILKGLSESGRNDADALIVLASANSKLGDLLLKQGDVDAALAVYERDAAIMRVLASQNPANVRWQLDLAVSLDRLGDIRLHKSDLEGALEFYRSALDRRRPVAAGHPGDVAFQEALWRSHAKVADVLKRRGDNAAAVSEYRQGLEPFERLAAAAPENLDVQSALGVRYGLLAKLLSGLGEKAAALETLRKGRAIAAGLAEKQPALSGIVHKFDSDIAEVERANAQR